MSNKSKAVIAMIGAVGCAVTVASPALAQGIESLPIPTLLAAPALEGQIAGAIAACIGGTVDPGAAIAAFTEGGWERSDEYEGTAGFVGPSAYAMLWLEPGFCMVETSVMGTEALAGVFLATLDSAGMQVAPPGKDDYGCPLYDLGNGLSAVLTSGGQDPVCDSTTDGALRFSPAGQ